MALTKYTMIFNYSSGITPTNSAPVRSGGWSESFYAPNQNADTEAAFRELIQSRLTICPRGTSCTRYRMQEVDPAGRATLRRCSYSAPNTWLSDIPQMALKIQFGGQTALGAFIREFRGIPDVQVTVGEYSPTAPFTTAVLAALQRLGTSVFLARRRDKTLPQYAIQSIAIGGIVTMLQATAGIALGSQIQVMRSIDPTTGRRIGYFARVTAFVSPTTFTIGGPDVKITNFGKLRLAAVTTSGFTNADLSNAEVVVRKVGRPFKAYSGRASKRR